MKGNSDELLDISIRLNCTQIIDKRDSCSPHVSIEILLELSLFVATDKQIVTMEPQSIKHKSFLCGHCCKLVFLFPSNADLAYHLLRWLLFFALTVHFFEKIHIIYSLVDCVVYVRYIANIQRCQKTCQEVRIVCVCIVLCEYKDIGMWVEGQPPECELKGARIRYSCANFYF